MMKNYFLVFVSFFCISLHGCSSSSISDTSPTDETDNNNNGELTSEQEVTIPASLTAASRSVIFDYTMPSVTGDITSARAQLFEPDSQAPQDGYPLVVWAHGTTGISNACQPSTSFEIFGNETAINSLLSAGYAVLAPDYEGFGTPRIHPYYQRSSHANAVIFSVPAAHKITGSNLSDDWVVVGHSQGGHVALATARGTPLPNYPLQAVAALAPGTDLKAFSDSAFDAIDEKIAEGDQQNAAERTYYLNVYAAYVAHALKEVIPAFDPESIFGDTVAPLIGLAVTETVCGSYANSIAQALNQHLASGGTTNEFAGVKRDWYDQPEIAQRLPVEEMGDEFQSAPLLIIQGDADRQVPVAATTAFVDRQRSLGTDVTYQVLPGGATAMYHGRNLHGLSPGLVLDFRHVNLLRSSVVLQAT